MYKTYRKKETMNLRENKGYMARPKVQRKGKRGSEVIWPKTHTHTRTHSQEIDLFYALCFPLSGKVGNSIKSTVEEITLGAGGIQLIL